MPTRRDFLLGAAALSGAAFAKGSIPEAIARALAINPAQGTTFRDAEHIVVLMQENRSFDHTYGALRGVRGFRDPRAHVLPNGNKVWFQTDARGDTYAPFRLDFSNTNASWIGGLPHSWPDQVDARNNGRYDKWLVAKPKNGLPFTLGYYRHEDIPFYYALADAFTICDQAFCSSLTGTTANRHFLWTGAIRRDATDFPRVQNSDTSYEKEANWRTFPERLQDAGVTWRIYQNEINLASGLTAEEDAWLANFSDNNIEWFSEFNVRFAPSRRAYIPKLIAELPARIAAAEQSLQAPGIAAAELERRRTQVTRLKAQLQSAEDERNRYNDATWNALSPRLKALHENAFATNSGDPAYRSLATHTYRDGTTQRDVKVPAGDVLFRFRQDVNGGQLPAISWIVGPENFSDHPSAPWYGAWYVSEVLNILTKNPEVWKKTIFILCYDENDGYFDHVPPFVAPHPSRPETGTVSSGINTAVEWANAHDRDSAVGLGYRVPLVVASPWSRGGSVNSQVFDHTSVLQLMETWLAANGKQVRETNISDWRRTVCGDLSTAFKPYNNEQLVAPPPVVRNTEVERVHAAQFRQRPETGVALTPEAIAATNIAWLQAPGTRPSCPLPYDLRVNAERNGDSLVLIMEARRDAFGDRSQGAPFNAYSYGAEMLCRSYAVRAGDILRDRWLVSGAYHLRVDGPNGFMREFRDAAVIPDFHVVVSYRSGAAGNGSITVRMDNIGTRRSGIVVRDESYGNRLQRFVLAAGAYDEAVVSTVASQGWYDFTVVSDDALAYRYAGRVESGEWSISDPAMGGR